MAKTAPKEDSSVSEKVLTDKLIDELRASGADLSKLTQNVTQPPTSAPTPPATPASPPQTPAPTPVASPPAAPPSPPAEAVPASDPSPAPEPPKKGLHLPHLSLPKRKKTPDPEVKPADPPASPVAKQLTNEALKEMVDDQLTKISSSDVLIIRLNKKELLIAAGLLIAVLWIYPFAKSFSLPVSTASLGALVQTPQASPVINQALPTPAATPAPLTIRVRLGSNSLETASEIKNLLEPIQAAVIDVVYDAEVHQNQVLVVTHQSNPELRTKLAELLSPKYQVASEAATLTDDSNFSATILIGKNAAVKK